MNTRSLKRSYRSSMLSQSSQSSLFVLMCFCVFLCIHAVLLPSLVSDGPVVSFRSLPALSYVSYVVVCFPIGRGVPFFECVLCFSMLSSGFSMAVLHFPLTVFPNSFPLRSYCFLYVVLHFSMICCMCLEVPMVVRYRPIVSGAFPHFSYAVSYVVCDFLGFLCCFPLWSSCVRTYPYDLPRPSSERICGQLSETCLCKPLRGTQYASLKYVKGFV